MLGYKRKKDFLRTYGIILCISLTGLLVRMAKFDELGLPLQLKLLVVTMVFIPVFWESLRFINRFLNRKYPFEHNLTGRVTLQLFLGALVGLIARTIIYFFGEPHIPFKLDALFLATTWALYPLATVAVNLGFFTSYFIERWKDGLLRASKLEQEKSQVQFNNLKNQLNPHFLFNALTSLNSLIFEDQRLASDFLQQLSKVYRYVLQHEDKNFVTLATELNFIEHYISLLHTRFDRALKISVEVDPEYLPRAIVPVTLQILIENAIKHNVVDPSKPLRIDVLTIGNYLVVGNNLQPRKNVGASNKRGLNDLRSLYRYLTEKPLIVEAGDDRFFVKVPLL